MENKDYYVYYSYEEWGRGYIGYRKCRYKKGYTPETEPYLGTYSDKSFKPTEKIILFSNLTKLEAMEIEIKLHAFYNVKDNNHFANKANANSTGFCFSGSKDDNPFYGKSYYNNGIEEKRFSPNEEIPGGYIIGGKPKSEEFKCKISKVTKGKNNPCYGKIAINNGIRKKYISPGEEIPEGYSLGGLPHSIETKLNLSGVNHHFYGKQHSIETKQKLSEANKIRVITSLCCYFSIGDAKRELGISQNKFYKLFEKDALTGFYIERF